MFAVQHPVGTVLGRASYSDYFICYHNCTVGANLDNDYPSFGRGIVMYGGSRVIGKTAGRRQHLRVDGRDRASIGGALAADSVLHGIYPNARAGASDVAQRQAARYLKTLSGRWTPRSGQVAA